MMLLLLALLAPPELAGTPGGEVSFDVTLVGAGEAEISASHPLVLDTTTNGSVMARIAPDAKPGVHDAYLYAAPISDAAVVVAAAQPVRVSVRNASRQGLLAGTNAAFQNRKWWLTPVLVIAGLMLLWVLGAFEVRLT